MNIARIAELITTTHVLCEEQPDNSWRCRDGEGGYEFSFRVDDGMIVFTHLLRADASGIGTDAAADLLYARDQLRALKLAISNASLVLIFSWPLPGMHEEFFLFTLRRFSADISFVRSELPEFCE